MAMSNLLRCHAAHNGTSIVITVLCLPRQNNVQTNVAMRGKMIQCQSGNKAEIVPDMAQQSTYGHKQS